MVNRVIHLVKLILIQLCRLVVAGELFTLWQEDKAKIRNVKVITSEECVPKHKLLVMDMWFKATKRRRRKFEPRVHVWKLKEEKT